MPSSQDFEICRGCRGVPKYTVTAEPAIEAPDHASGAPQPRCIVMMPAPDLSAMATSFTLLILKEGNLYGDAYRCRQP